VSNQALSVELIRQLREQRQFADDWLRTVAAERKLARRWRMVSLVIYLGAHVLQVIPHFLS